MEFNYTKRVTFSSPNILEDSFFLQPLDGDMDDDFKGLEINLIDQDINLYDNLIECITHKIDIEEWNLSTNNGGELRIGDYTASDHRDIKICDRITYNFLCGMIYDHCRTYIKELPMQKNKIGSLIKLRFDLEEVYKAVINYVNWQLDKLCDVTIIYDEITQEAHQ